MKYSDILEGISGKSRLFLGNEAIVRGALESGIDVYTYYPGTPSSEIGEIFVNIYKDAQMKWVESSINEKVALEVAGAAYARGATSMIGMKNVGLNVASDPLFALATTKPKNPNSSLVIIVADDPQQHSSAVEMDSRYYLKLLKIPAFEPSNSQECLEFTIKAFETSRALKIPVIVRTVTRVSHARSNVIIGDIKKSEIKNEFDLSKEVNVASRIYFLDLKKDQIYNRMNQASELSEASLLNKIEDENEINDYYLGIITSGVSYGYVKEALKFLELKAPIFKIGFINPIPAQKISEFLSKINNVLVVEENDPFIESQIIAIAQKRNIDIKIYGKHSFSDPNEIVLPLVGELNPTLVAQALIKITKIKPKVNLDYYLNKDYKIIKRKAILCPGCPHRTTGYALKQASNKISINTLKDVYFYQDIGCYTLLAYPPINFANVKYCMGSSIALAQGVAQTDDSLNIALIGDGTFFHSGIPALINGIHNKAPILVLILDNGWIGMTGQQSHPGSETRFYESGRLKEKVDLESILKGMGAKTSVITHRKIKQDYINKLKNLIYEKSIDVIENRNLNVILVKDECIQKVIKRSKPNVRKIKESLCKNCSLCYGQFLCPAISEKGNIAYIDVDLCLGCGVCEEICPNSAIKMEDK
jgi:indolepyruvate ferredoxin oxidoreductase alpha subunit